MMKAFFYSFYGKICSVLLLLLIILGTTQLYITYHSSMQYINAADQQLNLKLAEHIAQSLEPTLSDTSSQADLQTSIHYMMVFNPRIEIYVLDAQGHILSYFAPPKVVKLQNVSLQPIHQFLLKNPTNLILGDDPRNPGAQKPFSVAKMNVGSNKKGYLYIILSSQRYNSTLQMIENNYIVKTSLKLLAVILICTALVGLILFGLLTRRLRRMRDTVEAFEFGDYSARLNDKSRDEIGQLARSFNHMADTTQAHVKELRKTDKLRRNLIANVSHDLRSPLASMQGYLETILIKKENISDRERQQYLQTILNNTQLLRKMVEELFELSKLDARQIEPQKEPFSIAELVQDVLLKLKPRAVEKDVALSADFGDALPQVWADIALIERVLVNLLQNAIDYTAAKGSVKVNLDLAGDRIAVEVEDTGSGITKEDLPHIFDRFYRGDKSRSLAKGNTGLGLAIAKKILELHHVAIRVESEEKRGTRFSFKLPIYDSKLNRKS